MKLGIMQPYLCPYIGYFQLINAVDNFVIYDNIQYTKKGWINRNRILLNGQDKMFSVPLEKGSDYLDVRERKLASSAPKHMKKILAQITNSYRRAPYFADSFPIVESCFSMSHTNLFEFIFASIKVLCKALQIDTELTVSSFIECDHDLSSQDRVLAICDALEASTYINNIGGNTLYDKLAFAQHGIDLKFIECLPMSYDQRNNEFIPYLSIIDVLMFNGIERTRQHLNRYTLH